MFVGTVDRVSHEGGLLVSYTGACPALGSVMVDSENEYVGKVDGVIGNTSNSLVHISHLDRRAKPENMVGITIQIRSKRPMERKNFDRRDGRGDRRNDRRGDRGDRRNDRRGDRGDRRNDRRGDRGDRRNDRNNSNQNYNNKDWECKGCGNSNFSFRTECNRCKAPKNSRPDRRQGRDERSNNSPPKRKGDWDCPGCGKSNFANRTECFSCGKSKRVGGPRQRGHYRKQKDPPGLHSARYGRGKRD